jgi:integrase
MTQPDGAPSPTQRSVRRRPNGDGSIFRRKDGLWAAYLSTELGRRKYFYGTTREEVRKRLSAAIHARESGTLADARGTSLGDYLDQWLADVVRPNVRPWTYKGYEVHIRLHIKPALGRIGLDKLQPLHVQQLINERSRTGLSPKTVRYVLGTLRAALNQAMRWGLISRNPATLVDGPRVEQYEINPLSPEEARAFLAAVKGDRLEALYSVALTMGLRQGEALGLRWQDVDLDMGYIRVTKQLQRIDGRLQLVEPKTKRSRRTLALPASITKALLAHRNQQRDERIAAGERWTDSGLVFTTAEGRGLDGTAITKQFHAKLAHAGLPQRRFHDLRHSCATLLLVQGVSPRVVMDLLGHSQIGLTMNTYSHVIPDLRRDAAQRMDDLINDNGR